MPRSVYNDTGSYRGKRTDLIQRLAAHNFTGTASGTARRIQTRAITQSSAIAPHNQDDHLHAKTTFLVRDHTLDYLYPLTGNRSRQTCRQTQHPFHHGRRLGEGMD